uniref:Uncharacterized protein n=1 Tax=Avena sativa TaxID=4498 RepID=A0ACD5UBQ3_AVESA
MRVLGFAMAILVFVAISASSSSRSGIVLAARSPGVTSSRGALPAAEQPRRLVEAGGDGAAAAHLDASGKPAAAGSSPPPTVFDADRMSKRRVRRGSDPIHNKC